MMINESQGENFSTVIFDISLGLLAFYISRISLVFMLQEQIWSRDHSNEEALMSTKYKTLFYII